MYHKGIGIREMPCGDCKYLPNGLNNEPCFSCLSLVQSDDEPECRCHNKTYKRKFVNYERTEK